MKCKLALAAAVAAMACSAVFAAGRTMLAVPARHDMVGFGFDMLRQLPDNLELACYKGEDSIELLEVFDRAAREWRTISTENWASGPWRASSLVIAGENKAAADLSSISGWARQIKMPSDRAKLDVVNAVNSFQPLNEKQWKSLGASYGFKFTKVERPSARERRRDEARARREAARVRREEARQQREVEKALERQRKLMGREQTRPQTEIAPAPFVQPVQPSAVKPAPILDDMTLPSPFEKSKVRAIEVKPIPAPAPVEVKPAPAPPPVEVKPVPALPESKLPEAPNIVFKKREPAKDGKVPEIKVPEAQLPETKLPETNIPEVKAPEAKPLEIKPTEAEEKVKAAVEAAVSEAAAKAPKAGVASAPAPSAVEVRVPAREAVTPKVEKPAVPATIPEATPAVIPAVSPVEVTVPEVKVPAAKPVEVTAPELRVPAAKPVEVTAPEVKVPEVKPVQTSEIKVPAIVLDPM